MCNFHENDSSIRDQVIEKCRSAKLRTKLLEKENLTLKNALTLARAMEAVDYQMESMSIAGGAAGAVQKQAESHIHRVMQRGPEGANREPGHQQSRVKDKPGKCYRCGQSGHWGKDNEGCGVSC